MSRTVAWLSSFRAKLWLIKSLHTSRSPKATSIISMGCLMLAVDFSLETQVDRVNYSIDQAKTSPASVY
jgi:hypothetical protein